MRVKTLAVWCRAPDGATLYVDAAFEAMFGAGADALRADPDAWLAAVHPEDRARVAGASSHDGLEYRIVDAAGVARIVRARVLPIIEGTATIVEDVSEHRRRAGELRRALDLEARARLLADVAHELDEALTAAAWLLARADDGDDERVTGAARLVAHARELLSRAQGKRQAAESAAYSERGKST